MSDTLTTLGTILPQLQPRDAIHIAVLCMTAGETLRPGQHIGTAEQDILKRAYTTVRPEGLGRLDVTAFAIVDPFLKRPVLKGQVFWAFLYPNTITALRHDWTHPVIDARKDGDVIGTDGDGNAICYDTKKGPYNSGEPA